MGWIVVLVVLLIIGIIIAILDVIFDWAGCGLMICGGVMFVSFVCFIYTISNISDGRREYMVTYSQVQKVNNGAASNDIDIEELNADIIDMQADRLTYGVFSMYPEEVMDLELVNES